MWSICRQNSTRNLQYLHGFFWVLGAEPMIWQVIADTVSVGHFYCNFTCSLLYVTMHSGTF